MKYLLIIAGLLCSAGFSIYTGIKRGHENALTKYYRYSPSKGKEEVTLDFFNTVDADRKKLFGSEVLFNTQDAYLSGLSTFAFLIICMGLIIFSAYAFVFYRDRKKDHLN